MRVAISRPSPGGEQKAVPDLESYAVELSLYVGTLECITGELVEPTPAGINLPAEYRWEIVANTKRLLDQPAATFSKDERDAILAFAAAVEKVPVDAPALAGWRWRRSRKLAGKLLPMLRSHQQGLPDSR
jgi:hypothetical protein